MAYTYDDSRDDAVDGCGLDFDDNSKNTRDEEVDALVLFADVDFEDPDAVASRQAEWEALFT